MRASGWVTVGDEKYEFNPATDFGTLDWGRGVWTYDNTWFWGSGNCDLDGHAFGFNIGYGFGDNSAAFLANASPSASASSPNSSNNCASTG